MAKTLDQMLAAEKPDVVADAREKATKILLGIQLADLREHVNKTQGEIALALGVKLAPPIHVHLISPDHSNSKSFYT